MVTEAVSFTERAARLQAPLRSRREALTLSPEASSGAFVIQTGHLSHLAPPGTGVVATKVKRSPDQSVPVLPPKDL